MTVDTKALLPCPFCGCDDVGTESTATDGSVWCNGCRARITCKHYHPRLDIGQRDAINAWNRRPALSTLQSEAPEQDMGESLGDALEAFPFAARSTHRPSLSTLQMQSEAVAFWHNGMGQVLTPAQKAAQDETCASRFDQPLYTSHADLREALRALVTKLDEAEKPSRDVFAFAAVHGYRYTGPSYAAEIATARALLNGVTQNDA